MKYLHRTFREELSDESNCWLEGGVLYIRSRKWEPKDIVDLCAKEDGSNEIFDSLFAEWKEEWTLQRVEQADQILAEYGRQDSFYRLAEVHRTGGLIPFVGAGLSIPSGCPGWTAFLRKACREAALDESEFEALLAQSCYEEAAQRLADVAGPAFYEDIDSTFARKREVIGPIGLLPYIFSDSVITTNFDTILEQAFADAGKPFDAVLNGADSQRFRILATERKRLLLKLHGNAESSRERVLTQTEYNQHYSDASILRRTVQALYDRNNLLFLGCSLTADRLLTAFCEYVRSEGHDNLPRHYAFIEAPETEKERAARKSALAQYHIYPIWYPPGTHDESIEALLIKLHEDAQS